MTAVLAPTPYETAPEKTVAFEFPFTFYEAGPMSGIPEFNHPAFNAAAEHVRLLHPSVMVINPAEMDVALGIECDDTLNLSPLDWHDAMRRDLRVVVDCDGIFLLPGWEDSKGANAELFVARTIGLQVFLYDADHGLIWWPAA